MFSVNSICVRIGDTSILNGISCNVVAGECVGVIGPNGSGKTTLFNAISGFITHQHGTIFLGDRDISNLPPFSRAQQGIGRVFQNFGIFREMTVLENLVIALESRTSLWQTLRPWSSASRLIREQAKAFAAQVKLDGKLSSKAGTLSGGQMRLLEIVRTFAFGAQVFLLDEPTAGVSPKMKDDVADLIGFLRNQGKTILVIEHDIHFVQSFSNRVLVLDQGEVLLFDTPAKVTSDPRLQEIYFGKGISFSGPSFFSFPFFARFLE